MKQSIYIAFLAGLVSCSAAAENGSERAESQSRDASAAFVATQHFVVGRIGRDCLEELGRSETPLQYIEKWQRDNDKYYAATTQYMAARLSEISDPEERDAVESAYYASARQRGEAAVNQIFSKGPKNEVCKYAVTLVDAGSMNIEEFGNATKQPIMRDLAELVEWAKTR